MHALILAALLSGQPADHARGHAPVWRTDADGTADLGLWLGDRFLGRWVAAQKHYLPHDGSKYGPPCVLPPDAPQRRETVAPPLAYQPVFYPACFGGSCGPRGCH